MSLLTGRLIVGVEDDKDGSVRVYVGARYTGIHTHVSDPDAMAEVRRAWGAAYRGRLTANIPDDALCNCEVSP